MRHSFLIFGFIIVCSTVIYGQDDKLIYSKQVSNRIEKSNKILQKSDANVSVDFVEIDFQKVLDYEQFVLQFGEKNILINKERIDVRGINNFCFVGKDNMGSRIVMSVLDEDIQGIIETSDAIFSIETIEKNNYAIINIDQSKLREGCGKIHEGIEHSHFEEENNHDLNVENDNMDNFSTLKSSTIYDCKIRVLVLYTPSAQLSVSNIKNHILTAVDLTNQSFVDSNLLMQD